jgi:hypothetical protein
VPAPLKWASRYGWHLLHSNFSIAAVAEDEQARRVVRRYETIIATLVGVSAVFVSAYTAYMQRQQVRATVWPILEFTTSNEPSLRFTVDNKGVGPAIVRHVMVSVDGEPVSGWNQLLEKMLGPGKHRFTQSTISRHVFAAGESMDVMVPQAENGAELKPETDRPLWGALDKRRQRVTIEICYCSTLSECWTLRSGGNLESSTVEARSCPGASAATFQQ